MFYGLFAFAFIAVVCIGVGAVAMKRRRDYGNSEGTDEMGEAEFRKYEGFDE